MNIKVKILSFLLHHANRCTKAPEFYQIKNRLLKNAKHVGYDVQHIEGKMCLSCGGTGVHRKYGWDGKCYEIDGCWHCYGGWYKRPMWILLARKQFGRYVFHQPEQRVYQQHNPWAVEGRNKTVDGYIDHWPKRYSELAIYALYLMYNRKMFRKYFLEHVGVGWRVYWWYPRNYFPNLVHLIRRCHKAYPFTNLRRWMINYICPKMPTQMHYFLDENEAQDLPF